MENNRGREILYLCSKRELDLRRSEPYIRRTAEVPDEAGRLIRIVIGPRRAGKSFFITRHLMEKGPSAHVNFDDGELKDRRKIPDILTAPAGLYPGSETVLSDAIQNIAGWESPANRLARQGWSLNITGSNARLYGKEPATHLTGRHTVTTIFPFSFAGYLRARPGGDTGSGERTLRIAGRDLSCTNRIILSRDEEQEKSSGWSGIRGRIRYIPSGKWLQRPEIPAGRSRDKPLPSRTTVPVPCVS